MKRSKLTRWGLVSLLALAVGGASGCNVFAPFYFAAILMGVDARIGPQFEFPEDAQRVVVVTSANLDTQIATGHVDHELNEMISRKLFEGFSMEKNTKEIQVIRAAKVARWQDEHPDWHSLSPAEIGRAMEAQYVILVEVEDIGFYQDASNKMLLQGKAEVSVSVVKVDEDEGEVVLPAEPFYLQFPRGHPIPAGGDMPMSRFRRAFLARISEHVVWHFVPHENADDFARDPF